MRYLILILLALAGCAKAPNDPPENMGCGQHSLTDGSGHSFDCDDIPSIEHGTVAELYDCHDTDDGWNVSAQCLVREPFAPWYGKNICVVWKDWR